MIENESETGSLHAAATQPHFTLWLVAEHAQLGAQQPVQQPLLEQLLELVQSKQLQELQSIQCRVRAVRGRDLWWYEFGVRRGILERSIVRVVEFNDASVEKVGQEVVGKSKEL